MPGTFIIACLSWNNFSTHYNYPSLPLEFLCTSCGIYFLYFLMQLTVHIFFSQIKMEAIHFILLSVTNNEKLGLPQKFIIAFGMKTESRSPSFIPLVPSMKPNQYLLNWAESSLISKKYKAIAYLSGPFGMENFFIKLISHLLALFSFYCILSSVILLL